jgi:hypothetical protein
MTNSEVHEAPATIGLPNAPKERKSAKSKAKSVVRKKKLKKSSKSVAPRGESKAGMILHMIGRAKGATLVELMKATGWQAHSVRGFLSTAGKRRGITITSAKNDSGTRVYSVAK